MIFKPVQIKQRGKTYRLHYNSPDGRRRRLSVGKDFTQAQRLAVKYTDWLLEGKDPEREIKAAQRIEISKHLTIRDLFPRFMDEHGSLRQPKTQKSYKMSFKNISRCQEIVDVRLCDITHRVVLEYAHLRMKQDGVSGATVNREISFLQSMLSFAVKRGLLDRSPLQGIGKMKESEKRDVALTVEHVESLIAELPCPINDIVEFAIYTGFRLNNILGLSIEDIRFHDITETGEVELTIKGNRRELFPLSQQATALLKRVIGSRSSGYVFISPHTGTRYKAIHMSFDKAVRKLGLRAVNGSKLRFHDLRHVFATWLHRQGVSLDALRPLMGHQDRSTTDRYTTIDRLALGEVLSKIPNLRRA